MSQTHHSKVIILGSGPAGYTAAIYAARANLQPLLIRGIQPGGQMSITTDVENYPGFADVIQGPWLMEQMDQQAQHVGTQMIADTITKVEFGSRPFKLFGDSGDTYLGDAVVVATGAQARWLGIPNEEKFRGFGVSACATCDGFFFRGKRVAVVGGGNTAVEEALFLTNHATKVTLIHRRDHLRADKTNQGRLFKNAKIDVIWNSVVEDVVGGGNPPAVTGLKVKDATSGARSEVDIEGLFVAIGHTPATELFKGILDLDRDGYIVTKPDSTATNIPGVFAAGDVKDKVFRQAVTAAGMGCMAALEAERFLAHQEAATSAAAQ
ncbi:MAG TPA: thioredoxin-disulfide reductase [Alphaproteobacteria bacterium]